MEQDGHIGELQDAARYAAPCKTLRPGGIGGIIFGAKTILHYKRYADLPPKPDERIIRGSREMVGEVEKAKLKIDTTSFELQTKGKDAVLWKGLFLPDAAVFLKKGARPDILIERKGEVNITRQEGKTEMGREHVSVQIGENIFYGMMKPDYFARYETWKSSGAFPELAREVCLDRRER